MNKIREIRELDREKIIRPEYGKTSLKNWEPQFEEILTKLSTIEKHHSKVDAQTNTQISQAIDAIHQLLSQLIGKAETPYVSDKAGIVKQIENHYNTIKKHWPHYAIAALEAQGIFGSLDLNNQIGELTKRLQNSANEAIEKISKESGVIIDQASNKAREIEESARKSARGVSVQAAQDQFALAARANTNNIIVWVIITGLFIGIMAYCLSVFIATDLPDDWTWKVIYKSAIRATVIGFLLTLIAFGLKILRSHMHMREHNLHRKRLANSMAAFVESAISDEQRDVILSRLVDAVATFGTSGMIDADDEAGSKMTIDNVTRTINAIQPKA